MSIHTRTGIHTQHCGAICPVGYKEIYLANRNLPTLAKFTKVMFAFKEGSQEYYGAKHGYQVKIYTGHTDQ